MPKAKQFRKAKNKFWQKYIRHIKSRHNQTRRTLGQKALNESNII